MLRKSHLSYDASPEERMTYDGMWAWARRPPKLQMTVSQFGLGISELASTNTKPFKLDLSGAVAKRKQYDDLVKQAKAKKLAKKNAKKAKEAVAAKRKELVDRFHLAYGDLAWKWRRQADDVPPWRRQNQEEKDPLFGKWGAEADPSLEGWIRHVRSLAAFAVIPMSKEEYDNTRLPPAHEYAELMTYVGRILWEIGWVHDNADRVCNRLGGFPDNYKKLAEAVRDGRNVPEAEMEFLGTWPLPYVLARVHRVCGADDADGKWAGIKCDRWGGGAAFGRSLPLLNLCHVVANDGGARFIGFEYGKPLTGQAVLEERVNDAAMPSNF